MSQPNIPPPGAALLGAELAEDEELRDDAQDVEDGTPVGSADHEADVERSGADPDDV
jgi:hypothetical protein